tara:strand:- start:686 stop:1369 length:684 start_codon:yes stop_codon:yes gene_type:complete
MTTILTKKKDTTGVPATADLTNSTGGAELAINTLDQRLYTKNSSNDIVEVGIKPSTLDVAGAVSAGGAFRITNNVTASGTLNIGTNASVTGTLGVTGSAGLSSNVNVGGTLTGASTVSDQDGDLRDIPVSQNISGNYTLAIGDAGNQINVNASNAIITVPTGVFAVGDIVSVVSVNGCTASLACTAVNAVKAGDLAATALHTLDANGVASIMFSYTANLAVLTGNIS